METMWAIEPTYLKKFLETIENATLEDRQKAFQNFSTVDLSNDLLMVRGSTAYITIKGRLTNSPPTYISRYFNFNATVYQDIIDAVLAVQGNPEIKEVRLIMDTPGGTVDGVDETFQALMELRKSKKLIAISTGMVASAGYYLASAANEIWATAPTNELGSIGVVIAFTSWKAYDERLGIKEVTIVSKNAPNKAPDIDTAAGRDIIQERIDATERIFINRVAEGRKISADKIIKDFGQGGVLVAQDPDETKPDAISVGMVDALKFKMKIPAGAGSKKKMGFSSEADQVATIEQGNLEGENSETDSSLSNPEPGGPLDTNQTNKALLDNQSINEKRKEVKMDLTQFLAENPGAQAQLDAMVEKARGEGAQSANDKIKVHIDRVIPFLTGDFQDEIKNLAVKVLSGESSFSALEGAVVVLDIGKEKGLSEAAKAEAAKLAETPPGGGTSVASDGTLNTNEDFDAAVQRAQASG